MFTRPSSLRRAELVGLEHVAFGPDTCYGDHVGIYQVWSRGDSAVPIAPGLRYVAGLENPTERFGNIIRWLVKHSYSDSEICSVVGGNVLRVLRGDLVTAGRVVIVGSGAIGGIVGAHLVLAGEEVLFIDRNRAHVAAMREAA